MNFCCILSKFHIKPQLYNRRASREIVVSYRNSTSNHNEGYDEIKELYVVSYRNSTSNHNLKSVQVYNGTLYLIEIPHQTTTTHHVASYASSCILSKFHIKPQQARCRAYSFLCCILSKFHIKPQLASSSSTRDARCILSKFHIKPQPSSCTLIVIRVVSYRNSTSNHNKIQTILKLELVVSYRNSTSNHNRAKRLGDLSVLYLIEIPHQTTTHGFVSRFPTELYLIEIPHQTTTVRDMALRLEGCILSKFHIKPQPGGRPRWLARSCILSKFHIKPQRRASY